MPDTLLDKQKLKLCWRLGFGIMLLTIAIQVVIFNLAHLPNENYNTYIIAIFYIGVALAASTYRKFNIGLDWESTNKIPIIRFKNKKISFFNVCIILAILALTSIFIEFYGNAIHKLILLSVFLAAFFYEVLALSILDRIGFEEQSANSSKMVIKAYVLMSIGAAVSFWVLNVWKSTSLHLFLLMSSSLIISMMIIQKKNLQPSRL